MVYCYTTLQLFIIINCAVSYWYSSCLCHFVNVIVHLLCCVYVMLWWVILCCIYVFILWYVALFWIKLRHLNVFNVILLCMDATLCISVRCYVWYVWCVLFFFLFSFLWYVCYWVVISFDVCIMICVVLCYYMSFCGLVLWWVILLYVVIFLCVYTLIFLILTCVLFLLYVIL